MKEKSKSYPYKFFTDPARKSPEQVCPVCGATLVQEKCKVICRSEVCRYRIIYNCSEF